MRVLASCAAFLALIVWAPVASAHSYSRSGIKIGHVWALPAEGPEAQVFMPLFNGSEEADRLVSAESPRGGEVAFRNEDGETVSGFALPPGRPLAMRPGKRALILHDLAGPLETGQKFAMTLQFERAGEVEVTVWVEDAPAD